MLPVGNGSAAHALQPSGLRQRPQVVADGALGHAQQPREFGDADARLLADDISEALLTLEGRQGSFAY